MKELRQVNRNDLSKPMAFRIDAVLDGSIERDYSDTRNWGRQERWVHDFAKHTRFFKAIRKQGFLARQNFCWGSSEGGHHLHEICADRKAKGRKLPTGVCWYSTQNQRQDGCPIFLNFDHGSPDKDEPEFDRQDVGVFICEELQRQGIPYEWNGSASRCICIHPEDTTTPEYQERMRKEQEAYELRQREDRARSKIWRLENELAKAKEELRKVKKEAVQ